MSFTWQDVVKSWVSSTQGSNSQHCITDLIRHLAYANIIPTRIMNSQGLHIILLAQIMLETLDRVSVPKAMQHPTYFVYRANAKEVMVHDLQDRIAKNIKQLENDEGVNIHHYYKLNIENMMDID